MSSLGVGFVSYGLGMLMVRSIDRIPEIDREIHVEIVN